MASEQLGIIIQAVLNGNNCGNRVKEGLSVWSMMLDSLRDRKTDL